MKKDRLTEADMRDAIANDPQRYLGEDGLVILERELPVGPYRFDLLAQDRFGGKLIIELQKGTLDREHTFKILDYYEEYSEQHPNEIVEICVIANRIPYERQRRLRNRGISFKEIPESDFLQDPFIQERLRHRSELRELRKQESSVAVESLNRTNPSPSEGSAVNQSSETMDETDDISFDPDINRVYILNTDAKSLGNKSPHEKWFKYECAVTGSYLGREEEGYRKYGEQILGRFSPGDMLIAYANKIGAVGVGIVREKWDGRRYKENQLIYVPPFEFEEYRIKVKWIRILEARPIPAQELISANNNNLLNRTLVPVKNVPAIIELLRKYGVPI